MTGPGATVGVARDEAGVRVERVGPGGSVVRVSLARPERRNALDADMITALGASFADLAREAPGDLRLVVLGGDGPVFCAGADVAWMRAATVLSADENLRDARVLADALASIDACPVPVVVRVQGGALGGGAGLCAVGDVVVAEAGARFGFTEVRLGLIPATIAPFVARRIGEGEARRLFTTGERFDGGEAHRIGLVHRVVADGAALEAEVDRVVAAVLAGGPEAVRAAKALARETGRHVDAAPGRSSERAERSARMLAERRTTGEAREGLAAFEQRRRPSWAPPEDAR